MASASLTRSPFNSNPANRHTNACSSNFRIILAGGHDFQSCRNWRTILPALAAEACVQGSSSSLAVAAARGVFAFGSCFAAVFSGEALSQPWHLLPTLSSSSSLGVFPPSVISAFVQPLLPNAFDRQQVIHALERAVRLAHLQNLLCRGRTNPRHLLQFGGAGAIQ